VLNENNERFSVVIIVMVPPGGSAGFLLEKATFRSSEKFLNKITHFNAL
jgi:hypothetical protein